MTPFAHRVVVPWLAVAVAASACSETREKLVARAAGRGAPASKIASPPVSRGGALAGLAGTALCDVAERSVRSVVNISTSRPVGGAAEGQPAHPLFPFAPRRPKERRARSLGSGVIVTAAGVVLTNNHVVARGRDIQVTLYDGRELRAKVVGSDEKSDLAVLRISDAPKDLHPMLLGESSKLRLGEIVLAIGNPFGVGQTVTMGIVSAKGRANMGIVDYEDFIQTDAAINPGNSGGALVSLAGKLVGINTAILSRTGGYQGIGFAIPADMARPIMDSLLAHGRVIRGWLGVSIQELTPQVARALSVDPPRGILVVQVERDSPAQQVGLRRGDVITHLLARPVDSVVRLRNHIAASKPGTRVKLTVLREGASMEVIVRLGELPGPAVAMLPDEAGALGGLDLRTLEHADRQRLGLHPTVSGVVVTRVQWRSAAESAGFKENDIIVNLDRHKIRNAQHFKDLYIKSGEKITLTVLRNKVVFHLIMEK